MTGWLEQVFGFVCGQNPAHTWAPGNELLPCCQRCTGLYAGAALGLLLQAFLRFRPSARFLQVHGLFLLIMVPLGFHWVAHGAVVRTLSGLLFGFGVVAFLWLFPGARRPDAGPPTPGRLWSYAAGVGCSLGAVPMLAAWGGRAAATLLTGLVLAGLAGLGLLVLANVGLGAAWLVGRGRRRSEGGAA